MGNYKSGPARHQRGESFLNQRFAFETIERRHPAPRQIDTNPAHWADESFKLEDQVYAFSGRGTEESPVVLSDAYAIKARDIAYAQAGMAGYRLAELLNGQFR